MRNFVFGVMIAALSVITTAGASAGEEPVAQACDVCTCQSGEVLCLPVEVPEVLEELMVCGIACATVGSSHGSRERVESACSEVLACQGRSVPAANGMWLAIGAFAMLLLGGATLRRIRSRATS